MNPSASGWLKKLLSTIKDSELWHLEPMSFYDQLKATGFIYGSNIFTVEQSLRHLDLTEEERCKVNMIIALYYFTIRSRRHCPL